MAHLIQLVLCLACVLPCSLAKAQASHDAVPATEIRRLSWQSLPDLPDQLGLAGPVVGVHHERLIVAGGANFPHPVWESEKRWHDQIYVLEKQASGYAWRAGGRLRRPIAYAACVSTPTGIVCMGGNAADTTYDEVFLLRWNVAQDAVEQIAYPALPSPCVYGQATLIGDVIYLAGGQRGGTLDTAMDNFWALDLSDQQNPDSFSWQKLPNLPQTPRAFNLVTQQDNGRESCVYVLSGRCEVKHNVQFLSDIWEYSPSTQQWRQCRDLPRSVCAGTAIGMGTSQIIVLGGDDGTNFHRTDELRDAHPGFPQQALAYDTRSDSWSDLGPTPQNQVTTTPVRWNDRIIIASGELRPRIRTPAIWSITTLSQ